MNNMAKLAYNMFKYILDQPIVTNDVLFVERDIYDFRLLDELSLVAFWNGQYQLSMDIIQRILDEKKYIPSELQRLTTNMSLNKQKLNPNSYKKTTIDWENIDTNNIEKVFNAIYDNNHWGYNNQKYEITSGYGSSEEATINYRNFLKQIIAENNIKSIIDIGCGMWEFDHNEFDEKTYIGIDCVKRIVEFNKQRYGSEKKIFICADILDDKNSIPQIDLCIIKDVLQHLSNDNIIKLINKIKPKANYILLVNDYDQKNDIQDIKNGHYRPLSLDKYPLKEFDMVKLTQYMTKNILLMGKNKENFIISGKKISDIKQNITSQNKVQNNMQNKVQNNMQNNAQNNMQNNMQNDVQNEVQNNVQNDMQNDVQNDVQDVVQDEIIEKNIEMKIEKIEQEKKGKILLAILARNKAHVLMKYLECIDNLDYDKKLINIYINTNNNIDETESILEKWIKDNENNYEHIEYEKYDIEDMKNISSNPHDWTSTRFKILGNIRNKSLNKTLEYGCDYYFVIDCDNFIEPYTLKHLINEDKPIIAPMLIAYPEINDSYSNFFCDITPNGYYKNHNNYVKILKREIIGTLEVPVVHCTYLIKSEYIYDLNYIDNTQHHEFVIFSRFARNNNIKQYICNKEKYGTLVHFFDDTLSLDDEKTRLEKYELIKKNREILE
jgi:SAM-dependent methyltransferase